jgi:hypothetical protein
MNSDNGTLLDGRRVIHRSVLRGRSAPRSCAFG